ncbi:MAG TPA: S1 RNA-binding domain-containing protein [Vicinamibacterales bacterium]|nr:S1 RNA-binding domain-containing protein [Vicinamibacterales bacterium]
MSEPEEDDFEKMFEASTQARRIEKGRTIEGTIVAIGGESALVDVGSKSEAEIDIDELKDEDGDVEVAVGDRIQATVVSTAGGLKLSRKLALGAVTARQLEDAFRARLPVEGRVEGEVKGGYEVRVARQRAFCPVSQIDVVRNTEPAQHIGRVYRFLITEYKEGGRNLVVSRRTLLEQEQQAQAVEARKSIIEGAVITGRVVSVREFGAFVELGGGIQGLLHVSEMAWARIADPSQVAKPGDEITVKVLRVDTDTQKISLGLKQLLGDPWSKAGEIYKAGQLLSGRVMRVADFGVFVELEPGVDGLIPASETGIGRDGDLKKAFPVGTEIQFVVIDVDPGARRIRLSLTDVQKMREADEVRDYTERGDAKPAKGFGSMADKLRDALGKGGS